MIFSDSNDLMISDYTVDGVYLTEAGYVVWQNYIKEFINNWFNILELKNEFRTLNWSFLFN